MAFSNFTPAGPQSVRLEEFVEIKVENDTASEIWIACNGFLIPMEINKQITNGFKKKLYGWMVSVGLDLDLKLMN